jgi:hypothetical protein
MYYFGVYYFGTTFLCKPAEKVVLSYYAALGSALVENLVKCKILAVTCAPLSGNPCQVQNLGRLPCAIISGKP